MLNIPDKVKIGWRNYDIVQGDNIEFGSIQIASKIICLCDKLDRDEKSVTLLHEITHGILYNIGSELISNELFIEAFSENLYQLIIDNPSMFKQI